MKAIRVHEAGGPEVLRLEEVPEPMPAPDEIVYVLVMSTGARVHARVGGLKAEDIAKWDGLR